MELREQSAKYLVRPTYKRTEVGVIPEDWDVHPLGHLTDANRPISYGIVQTGPNVPNGVRCLRVLDVENGRINKSDLITTTREISTAYKRTILKAGDLVMPLRGKVGDVGIIDEDLSGSNLTRGVALIAIRSDWSGPFCRQFIAAPSTRGRLEQSMNGSALQEIPIAVLRAFKIALPPTKAEQEAIAEALSDADALIESLDQLIAKKRDLKQGAMQELLTGKKRLPGFSGEWEVRRLGELADMGSGGTPPSSNMAYYDGNIPWVAISDMTQGGKYIGSTERNLSDEGFTNSAAQMFPAGTVLYAMYASLGECSIATVPLSSSQAILGIRAKQKLNGEFLYYFLQSIKPMVKTMGQQGTQANLNKRMVQDFNLRLPSHPEQTAIATILSDMDTELTELQSRLAKARQIKQGMMQELLTGRIRLL
jgi:type I restriction enzyme S subunit